MRIMRKTRKDAEQLPRGYGIAYHDWTTEFDVCYPIPFNIIVAWWRALSWARWVRCPASRFLGHDFDKDMILAISKAESAAWNRGYKAGFDVGMEQGSDIANKVASDLLVRIGELGGQE